MSDDDNNPSDKALEAGENGDISRLPNFRGHGPKLSPHSRAINPRALLQAEAEGQSRERDMSWSEADQFVRERGPADPYTNPYPPGMRAPAPPRDPYPHYAPPPEPRPHSTLPRGMPRVLPPPMRQPAPPPPPPPPPVASDDARVWDAYASAALQAQMGANLGVTDAAALIDYAATVADFLLEERRRRFS